MPGVVPLETVLKNFSPPTSLSSRSSSIRRIFGTRGLWARQSQISWKWIRTTLASI
jgi:hypothetical protein